VKSVSTGNKLSPRPPWKSSKKGGFSRTRVHRKELPPFFSHWCITQEILYLGSEKVHTAGTVEKKMPYSSCQVAQQGRLRHAVAGGREEGPRSPHDAHVVGPILLRYVPAATRGGPL